MTLASREAQKKHFGLHPRLFPALAKAGYLATAQGKRSKHAEDEALYRPSDLAKLLTFATPTVVATGKPGEVNEAVIHGQPWVDIGNIVTAARKQKGITPAYGMATKYDTEELRAVHDYIAEGAVSWQVGRYAEEVVEYRYGPRWDDYTPYESNRYTTGMNLLTLLVPKQEAIDLVEIVAGR
jgi:hypothetical protein